MKKTFQQPNYVKFDVMLNDRYVCTMKYIHLTDDERKDVEKYFAPLAQKLLNKNYN